MTETERKTNDFTQGAVPAVVTRMALPLIAAQLVNVLYNVVDRVYIGHIPVEGSAALTGVGVALPVITALSAFAGLFGQGGAPLCSIARGRKDLEGAARVMGNSLTMLLAASLALMALAWGLMRPVLYLFGASDSTIGYAMEYLGIYVAGTPFVMVALGMNPYINAQGFARLGMMTVLLGAAANILLDPLFIFTFGMGVRGAALATVLSQALSAGWCLAVLLGKKAILRLTRDTMRLRPAVAKSILSLGITNFVMSITNSLIQAVANRQLGIYGGDLYVGAITVINSLRTVYTEVIHGFGAGLQPVIGYNYGAGVKKRVLECIRFATMVGVTLGLMVWGIFVLFPRPLIRCFTPDETLMAVAVPAVRIYFCGFGFMSLQFVAQNTFQGLGRARSAIVFSVLRKVVLVLPLMLILPRLWGLGAYGVYWSEPVSDILGGGAAFTTMMLTVYRPIHRQMRKESGA